MLIYRFENEQGQGPFTAGDRHVESRAENNRWIREFARQVGWVKVVKMDVFTFLLGGPPEPDDGSDNTQVVWQAGGEHPHHNHDIKNLPDEFDNHEWKVGCKDLDQLLHWFPKKAWMFLKNEGFQIVTYEVDCEYVRFGEYQLMFCTDVATVVPFRE